MKMILDLPPELESRLTVCAEAEGKSLKEFVEGFLVSLAQPEQSDPDASREPAAISASGQSGC